MNTSCLVLSNGGFHLDGLADTFDALAAKGDREKKLSVMKDGTIGPVGVIAVFFSLLIKYLAIKNLTLFPLFTLYSSLLFMPAISKLAMVISMFYGKSARADGLGRLFIQNIRSPGDPGCRHYPPFRHRRRSRFFSTTTYVGQPIYILCNGPDVGLFPLPDSCEFFQQEIWRADRGHARRNKRDFRDNFFTPGDSMVTTLYLIRHGETEGS